MHLNVADVSRNLRVPVPWVRLFREFVWNSLRNRNRIESNEFDFRCFVFMISDSKFFYRLFDFVIIETEIETHTIEQTKRNWDQIPLL